ncbi:hypothetical protein GCM10022224_086570 [Nonomuraea antimicrobica]|uniref:DUF2975 domain-containing protein n=1 Tax=Nonomuraea antimicrobica TaxID=561173 RepID=A0ABP7DT59_9ACTN
MPSSPTTTAPPAAGVWTRRLHALLITTLVLSLLASLAGLIADVMSALSMAKADYGFTGLWPSRADVSLDGALAPGVRALHVTVEATLHDPARAPMLAALHLFTWLPGALVLVFSLFLLVRITSRGVAGDRALFSTDTVRDLRKIGTILTLGSLAACALDFAAKTVAARMMTVDAYVVPGDVGWPFVSVLTGVGVFVVAEVIGRGLAMLDEIEGTI